MNRFLSYAAFAAGTILSMDPPPDGYTFGNEDRVYLPALAAIDVKMGRVDIKDKPVRLWMFRKGCWNVTKIIPGDIVPLARLRDSDRIEIIEDKTDDAAESEV